MHLARSLHLAYCTNVHPGENWEATLASLNRWTLGVKERLARPGPFAIGLRLSAATARELASRERLLAFQRWLEQHECYVFTINGFPYGRFHGAGVKEEVYRPDWTQPERLEYTNLLFDLLAQLVPAGVAGSVSTLPGSFKDFITTPEQEKRIRDHLWRCVEHIGRLGERTGLSLHLGLEPEPLCWLENSRETARFFELMRDEHPGDGRLGEHLGVNYDTCHFAIEFEEPEEVLARFERHGIRLSKIHLSNALTLRPSAAALERLGGFAEDVYLHQVAVREAGGAVKWFKDLPPALAAARAGQLPADAEWRVHFHIPLHSRPPGEFGTTADHVLKLLRALGRQPQRCSHLEMETYTWAVLPEELRAREVTDQIVSEYQWTLARLADNGLTAEPA